MKVKLIHMAMLLFFVMSVMFLAQTQDGIGHSANEHDPVFHVDGNGNEVAFGQGNDPRGLSFGKSSDGSVIGELWSEGWQYGGGLLNGATEEQTNDPTKAGHPSDDTDQAIYILQIGADCYAGHYSCRSEIKPSVKYVDVLAPRRHTFQGWGSVELIFSGVCYQEVVGGGLLSPYSYEEREREETRWSAGQAVLVKVTLNEYAEKRTGSWGAGITQGDGTISASYSHEYEEKHNDLHARGFGIKAKLTATSYDDVIYKQDKYAGASGYLEGASAGDIGAGRPGIDIVLYR